MKPASILIVALSLTTVLSFTGCSRNPTLSEAGYQQALALFNSCSRKDDSSLDRIQAALTKAKDAAELSPDEVGVLQEIIDKAKQGKWDAAVSRSRTLLEKQATESPVSSSSSSGEVRQRHRH